MKKVVNQLMDAIGLISNSLKSGYSFGQGLELVTREMPPPIADEFHQVLVEMNLGGSVEEALVNLSRRVPSYDIDLMVTAFVIQRQVGGNLAEVLDSIAHTIRERIRILGEVRVQDSKLDVVKGLEMGADAYITKPFGRVEMEARVQAILRRAPALFA